MRLSSRVSTDYMPESDPLRYKQKYRIPSIRYQGWFYGWDGCYTVTLCTADRWCLLGQVHGGRVRLLPVGQVVRDEWLKTPSLRTYVRLDEFVIMPNHLHVILIIDHSICCGNNKISPHMSLRNVHQQDNTPDYRNSFGPQRHNLSSIVGGFKSAVTAQVRLKFPGVGFAWQPRFYDRVVRTERELEEMRLYIRRNPEKWGDDEYLCRDVCVEAH